MGTLHLLRRGARAAVGLIACVATVAVAAHAHEVVGGAYTREAPVALYERATPDWEAWPGNLGISEETVSPSGDTITNVSRPTYEPYLPTPERNTGTAVIVAPGGAFRGLAYQHEGRDVAEWLAERGVAAFVLKYRLVQYPLTDAAQPGWHGMTSREAGAPAVQDGARAIALIRRHAAAYGVDPNRIGIVGFSAGAHVAGEAGITADSAARPNFAALIYGAPFYEDLQHLPALPRAGSEHALPPMFFAGARNDGLVTRHVLPFIDALAAAGYRPEAHIYSAGGHGFGMRRQGTTSDMWIDEFFAWMQSQGLTRKPGDPEHVVFPGALR